MPISIFPIISLWKFKVVIISNGKKNNIFIEATIINNSAKFQLYPPYSFSFIPLIASEELIFFLANLTFRLMATNQIERFGLK